MRLFLIGFGLGFLGRHFWARLERVWVLLGDWARKKLERKVR